jgi:Fe-S-cluster containining protein
MRETDSFHGTQVQELVDRLDAVYTELDRAQSEFKKASPFPCPDGCGTCCVDFEPDVLECEALYLAAWMIAHQPERADAILAGSFVSPRPDPERGCFLFNPDSPYHCTVYEGRCLICRLFGYTGDRGKDGLPRWKPCKFLPAESAGVGNSVGNRQYSASELESLFGAIPPVMGDITAQAVALDPDGAQSRKPLHEALPSAIAKIRMLQRFAFLSPDPDAPEPNPESPMPRAS